METLKFVSVLWQKVTVLYILWLNFTFSFIFNHLSAAVVQTVSCFLCDLLNPSEFYDVASLKRHYSDIKCDI